MRSAGPRRRAARGRGDLASPAATCHTAVMPAGAVSASISAGPRSRASCSTTPAIRCCAPARADRAAPAATTTSSRRSAGLVERCAPLAPQCAGVGIGTPGAISSRTGLMKNSNTACLNGRDLPGDLARRSGLRVAVENDANCFALAEARRGAGQGARMVFGVIMGTGVGGGLVLDGRLWSGPQHIAGEWGHHVIDPAGPHCYCGQRGCVESLIAGPAVERRYRERGGERADMDGDRRPRARRRAGCAARVVRRVPRPLRARAGQSDQHPRPRRRRARRRPVATSTSSTAAAATRWRAASSTTSCARRSAATSSATRPASSAPRCSKRKGQLHQSIAGGSMSR